MKNVKYRTLIAAAVVAVCSMSAAAQNAPQSNTVGANGSLDQQIIGDTTANADRTQSTSNQIGNSANANGAQLGNYSDTRDQNTVNSAGGAATGGAATGNLSSNDNRSSVGNTSSSSGGNNTGGNNLSNGGNTTGGNTMSNGSSSGGNTTTSAGGAGGAGGSSSSNGTNAQGQGQQQGIDRSGNSANTNANTAAQGQGQQQANNGTNAQGQTSANTNTAGGNTGGNSANRNSQATNTSAGNGAGAGAGSNNRTAMQVDASDRSSTSYESKTIVHAPVIHGQAAPALAAAGLVMVPGQCGPRVQIIRRPVIGKRFGVWGGQSDVEQGYSEEVAPATDGNGIPVPFVQQDGYLMGHQVTQFVAVLGTSSAGSFSIGGFGKDGQGGQGGGAASGQLQQIVGKVAVIDCVMPSRVVAAAPVAPALVAAPMPAPRADRN